MFLFAIFFLIGDLYLQTVTALPSHAVLLGLGALLALLMLLLLLQKKARYFYVLIPLLCGFLWSAWCATMTLAWSLPKELESKILKAHGFVASIPVTEAFGTRFDFYLTELKSTDSTLKLKTLIRLRWRDAPVLRTGDEFAFLVRLKRIHGLASPGAFDYEAWAMQKGLRAQGVVVKDKGNHLISPHRWRYLIQSGRQLLQEKIIAQLPKTQTSPWLLALITGERNGIATTDWQVLRQTGTNHLMAIAGLHIGMLAGITHQLVAFCWRLFPFLLFRLPAQHAGACASLMVAIFYSALAGFSVPTQRACLMLCVLICALLLKRQVNAWQVWSLALLGVLMLNPLSVLTTGFWLSFGTIALIIFGMGGRLAPTGWWWKWGRVQWVVGLGLMPLSFLLFQQGSLVSFFANSIAIPWLGFFILPFCFLSAIVVFFIPPLAHILLMLADKSLMVLWAVLTWFSHWEFASWTQAIPHASYFVIVVGAMLLLIMPAGLPGRLFGLCWLLPLFFYQPPMPPSGHFWLTVLDVGQGLSVLVQTHKHTLLFDAGPKFPSGFDAGENIVLPYLRKSGIKRLDRLIISHGDNDHIGGAYAIINALPAMPIMTSVPEKFQKAATVSLCEQGMRWEWEGVQFSFLYPKNQFDKGNDSSCVLRIDNGHARALLTGDIEKYAEGQLLSHASTLLKADILIAPHHGSKTSGGKKFIAAINPRFVVYAVGYKNRYHFPHKSVVAAYQDLGAIAFNMAKTGTLQFKVGQGKTETAIAQYRVWHKRYWMDD